MREHFLHPPPTPKEDEHLVFQLGIRTVRDWNIVAKACV